MISVHEFTFTDKYKDNYKEYKKSHKVLVTDGEKSIAVFNKSCTEIVKEVIPTYCMDIKSKPLSTCCTINIRRLRNMGYVFSHVTILIPRTMVKQFEDRSLRYLDSLQAIYGKIEYITGFVFDPSVDTHAKATIKFCSRQEECV